MIISPVKSVGALYADLGQALFNLGRYQEAASALRQAIKEEAPAESVSERAQVYFVLGKTYKALDKPSDATTAFARAVSLNPDMLDAVEGEIESLDKNLTRSLRQAFRNSALNLAHDGKFDEAERGLKLVLRVSGDDAEIHEQLGIALLAQGKTEKSIEHLRKAIKLDRKRGSAYVKLGQACLQLRQYEDAVRYLNVALELDARDTSALRIRAEAWVALEDITASERDLRQAIQLAPSDYTLYIQLAGILHQRKPAEVVQLYAKAADLLVQTGLYSVAQAVAAQALRIDDRSHAAYLQLARALMGQQRYAEARAYLQLATRITKAPASIFFELARAYQGTTEYSQGLDAINKALQRDPESNEALLLKGELLYQLGRPKRALSVFDKVLARGYEHPQAYIDRGNVLGQMGKTEDALEAYYQAVELDPKFVPGYTKIGLLRLARWEFTEGISMLDKALEIAPDASLYRAKGKALRMLGIHGDAIDALDEALKLSPNDAFASYYRGSALNALGRYEEALVALQLAVDLSAAQSGLDKEDSEEIKNNVYIELGEALAALMRFREAKSAFEKALETQEDNVDLLLRYSETLRSLGMIDEAIESLRRAVKYSPGLWSVRGTLAAALSDNRQFRSAVEEFNKAIRLDKENSWAYGSKGATLRIAGEYTRALEALDRALQLYPEASWILTQKGALFLSCSKDVRDAQRALPLLQEAIRIDSSDGWAWGQLGICFCLLGKYEDAISSIDQCLTRDPTLVTFSAVKGIALDNLGRFEEAKQAHDQALPSIAEADDYLNRADAYATVLAYDRAAQDFYEAIMQDSTLAVAYNDLAWFYVEDLRDNLEEAEELAQMAKEFDTNPRVKGNILDTLGWIYYKRGKREEALKMLREATQLESESLLIRRHYVLCKRAVRRSQQAK